MPTTTIAKDLREGHPVWTRYPAPRLPVTPLKDGAKADVAIIGAGVSGAMLAEELSAAGLKVALFDKRGAAKGATLASTALVQYEIDTPLIHLSKSLGEEKATAAWRRSRLAVASLTDRIANLGIPCAAAPRDSLYLAGNVLDADGLREEQRARAHIGLQTEFLSRKVLTDDWGLHARPAALHSRGNLSLNPRQLTLGLLKKALENGATLHAPVTVASVNTHRDGADVITTDGKMLTAKHVVYAAGYELPQTLQGSSRFRITSTWAFATRPQRRNLWGEEAFLWEAADPYLYIRTTADGRVICGGEDDDIADAAKRDALLPEKIAALQTKLARLCPKLDVTAEYTWAGFFGNSTTTLPSIGKLPGMANTYAVLAYGGNGTTFSRIAAEILRAEFTGKSDPDSHIFAF
ncbi:MAG: FAD-binding oxidoreductase [Alphaproteobacteria bacterium]|nr:FAD-binding oxidoreductase [Alphaproteobacteria bacterium]